MKEIILTSSVLIAALILLRRLFQGKVSQRILYAAWILVAARLLIPVQFGSLDFSVLTQAEPVTEVITEISQNPISGPSREEIYTDVVKDYIAQGQPVFIPSVQAQIDEQIAKGEKSPDEIYEQVLQDHKNAEIILPDARQKIDTDVDTSITAPTVGQVATIVWIAGMMAMAGWFVGINVSFRRGLKRTSQPLEIHSSPIPVRVDPTLSSPCLFGLFRPTVYLTPACTQSFQVQHHVLTHELSHYKQKDHIWSWVRCLCLCIFWFNPLVWIAADLSKRDCELACDEAAIKALGESQRIAYGKTLVDMVAQSGSPSRFLETATAMHETKEQLVERISRIARKPKFLVTTAVAMLLILAIVTGCAFAGVSTYRSPEEVEPEIKQCYFETVLKDYQSGYTAQDLTVTFYGQFEDVYVIYVEDYLMHLTVMSYETVAGVTFAYGCPVPLYAYHDGNLYSLQEAYDNGLLSWEDLITVDSNYEDGVDDNKKPDSATEPSEETKPSEETEPTETTAPTEPAPEFSDEVMALLPDIPSRTEQVPMPDNPTIRNMVDTIYNEAIAYTDLSGNARAITLQVPALTPFSEDAIAINESIRQQLQPFVEDLRRAYDSKIGLHTYYIKYSAHLCDDILSLVVEHHMGWSSIPQYIYSIDLSTGQQLSTTDLIQRYLGMSYPEFWATAATVITDQYKEKFEEAGLATQPEYYQLILEEIPTCAYYAASIQLYPRESELMMRYNEPTLASPSYHLVTIDAAAWKSNTISKADAYKQLFTMIDGTAYGNPTARNDILEVLWTTYNAAPEEFLSYLAMEDADIQARTIDLMGLSSIDDSTVETTAAENAP